MTTIHHITAASKRTLATLFAAFGCAECFWRAGWWACKGIAYLMDPSPTPGNDPMLAIGMMYALLVGPLVFVVGMAFGGVCAATLTSDDP